jgi:hypothetical protein
MPRKTNSLDNIVSKGVRQDNGCLLYTNSQQKNGYALVSYDNKMMPVHRVVFLLSGQTISQGFDVHHLCHNKLCIEITHLVAISRRQHALLDEHDMAQRQQRLRALLTYDPTVELFPHALSSTTIALLWGCQSSDVPILLQKIQESYPDEFSWRALLRGHRGPKPSVFALQMASSLVEKLLIEDEQRETPAEDILMTLVA